MTLNRKRSWIAACLVSTAPIATGGCAANMPPADTAYQQPPTERAAKADALKETAQEYENNPWKKIATPDDQDRIYGWEGALDLGVTAAMQAGEGGAISRQAALFDADSPLENSILPPGLYDCAITKLGGPGDGLPFVAYPPFRCRVHADDGRLHFTKLTGSQLTTGWIYRASDRHSVFLGTSFYGYEDKAVPYGNTKERDQAAVVQRIGENRWRMVFPYPYYESVVDVMELTPVGE